MAINNVTLHLLLLLSIALVSVSSGIVKKSVAEAKADSNEMVELTKLDALLDDDAGSGSNSISVISSEVEPSRVSSISVVPTSSIIAPTSGPTGRKGRKGRKGKGKGKGKGRKGKKGKGRKGIKGRKGDAPEDNVLNADDFVEEQTEDGFFKQV
ncbi:uncharacterized protein [Montipora capricornis]|uniref:uncharacterized protein n=1 Tax=Montipora capricornis TaxID=246305 RepID=UPI0035F1AF16